MRRVYLTCEESNIASRKTIEALGAELLEITDIPKSCFFWRSDIERYCIYKKELA
jgi:predicted acetyltransferase